MKENMKVISLLLLVGGAYAGKNILQTDSQLYLYE